ncbi:MAG: hypothetical protein U9N59_10555 [Campylobacterota bacterium]|nr:hypothetical protein [Campylobacterota bacterium]
MKRVMSLVVLVAIGLGLSGCAVKSINNSEVYNDKNRKVGYELIQIPKLNTVNITEIGENIYQKNNKFINTTNTVKLKDSGKVEYSFDWFTVDCEYNKGDTGLLELWNNTHNSVKTGKCFNNGSNQSIKGTWGNIIDKNKTGYFTHLGLYGAKELVSLENKIKYSVSPTVIFKEDSFKYEALYQGKQGNKIKVTFREFYLNETLNKFMIRDAFTQNIDYELNKDGSTIIGFKGLRIEVLKATNMDITYKVIKDYN